MPELDHVVLVEPIEMVWVSADEYEYLKWFRCSADFGPADGDVQARMDEQYELETGRKVPKGWRSEE